MFDLTVREPKINSAISNKLLLANNCLFAMLLAGPMIPLLTRYFTNTWLCVGLMSVLVLLDFLIASAVRNTSAGSECCFANCNDWKLKAKILAWAVLASTVILVGAGPLASSPSAYSVDKFTRIIGRGIVNDYSVTKKIHYFYFAIVIYGLLIFNIYQNILLALISNLHNKIKRLGNFSDTLLFVGYSFLLVCVYRQFSNQYSYDLTLYLLKSVFIFCIPAFYLWQNGRLALPDVRILLALTLFSLVISVNITLFFDTRDFAKFGNILALVLSALMLLFIAQKTFNIFNDRILYAKILILSFLGSLSLVVFSLSFEFSNILALKTNKFINIGFLEQTFFYTVCWLAIGCFFCARRPVNKKTANLALLIFVAGLALLQFQPSLVMGAEFDINESANHDVPISDFLRYGKIPLFENFPGHGLYGVISSVVYGLLTSDYQGAIFTPWRDWLYCSACIVVLYCFIKSISNGLVAVSVAILLPYFVLPYMTYITSYPVIGLTALLPYALYLKTLKKRHLAITVLLALFLAAYKLDIGFAFIAGIVCSSICVTVFCRKRIIFNVLLYFAIGGASVLLLFLAACLFKDINPLARIQEFMSTASSNEHWGHGSNGDTEKILYSVVYFIVPVISVVSFIVAVTFRAKFSAAELGVLFCLLFAYYANLPRILVIHNFMQYSIYSPYWLAVWLWTMPIAFSLLISKLCSQKSLIVFCQTTLVLCAYIFFQNNTFYDNSPLQNAVNRAERLTDEVSADNRKNAIDFVFKHGSRVVPDETKSEHLFHASEVKAVADMLLTPEETFIDFTNQSAAYAWSGRENPTYTVQPPSMLSGEKGQELFIRGIESRIDSVPIAIMPTNISWYYTLNYGGMSNNIRHYLVAEWIYNNYRPLFKYNDFASVWVLNSKYDEYYKKLHDLKLMEEKRTQLKVTEFVQNSKDEQKPLCHNCEVQITPAGLRIQPTGPDPFLMDFDKFIGADGLRSFTYLTLYLSEDNNEDYQVFFTNGRVKDYSEAFSAQALSVLPRVKVFDFRNFYNSVGQLEGLRLDVPEKGVTVIKTASISTSCLSKITMADWGYDNFIPGPWDITYAHDYYVELLPYVWGQFDTKQAADYPDLSQVSKHENFYSWDYSGHEHNPAYVRIELSIDKDFLAKSPYSYLYFGNSEDGKFMSKNRYWFKLKPGKNVYLFRVSSDYYWSRGQLTALFLDPNINGLVTSVRLLKGD